MGCDCVKIIKTRNCPDGLIEKDDIVKVTDMGKIKEVRYMYKVRTEGLGVKKISKDEYIEVDTGEVHQYNHGESRKDNVDGLRKTFKKIRGIINYNFHGKANELMITLTYKENMTDVKRLHKDFVKFWKRFKYKYGNDIDYFNVVEPQARGAWHCHVLVKFNDKEKIYIDNKELADIWGHGFITVKSLKAVDNIGAYLSAYLGDIEVTDENNEYIQANLNEKVFECKTIDVDGQKKKFIKGGRLYLYPVGMNIYRKSKGILMPTDYNTTYGDFKKEIGDTEPFYKTAVIIGLDDDFATGKIAECNRIVYEQYKIDTKTDGK